MKKFLNLKFYILNLAVMFIFWRIYILISALLAVNFLPRFSDNFLAGRVENYVQNPLFWGWANFDGEHYLSIAIYGYKDLQQAFFPVFPYLIKLFSVFFGTSLSEYLLTGLMLSNVLFLFSLVIFWKVVRLDYSEKVAKLSVISLLVFPTSFYFGAVYTESLFLFTSLLAYYFYRKEKYLAAGLVGAIMTATRIYGVFIVLMILIEMFQKRFKLKEIVSKKNYFFSISLFGILGYMYYLYRQYSDPLAFYNLQTLVGEQHQKGIVLLPQVFYRYIKILFEKMPIYTLQTYLLEIVTGLMFLLLPIYGYIKKVRLSYLIYILLGFLVPSAQGSFSSVPRYVVVLFPAFIVLSIFLSNKNIFIKFVYFLLSALWLMINTGLFIRGYWVA